MAANDNSPEWYVEYVRALARRMAKEEIARRKKENREAYARRDLRPLFE